MIQPVNADTPHLASYNQRLYYEAALGASREQLLPELLRMLRLRWRVIQIGNELPNTGLQRAGAEQERIEANQQGMDSRHDRDNPWQR